MHKDGSTPGGAGGTWQQATRQLRHSADTSGASLPPNLLSRQFTPIALGGELRSKSSVDLMKQIPVTPEATRRSQSPPPELSTSQAILDEEEPPPPPPPPRHHRKTHKSSRHAIPPNNVISTENSTAHTDSQSTLPCDSSNCHTPLKKTNPYANMTISPKTEELYTILVNGDSNSKLEVLRSLNESDENSEISALFITRGIQPLLTIVTGGQPITQELALTILSQLILVPDNIQWIACNAVIDALCTSLSMTAHQSLIERNLKLLLKLSELWDESHVDAWCTGLPPLITSLRNAPVMHPDTLKLSLSLFLSLLQPSHFQIHKTFCEESGVPVFLELMKLDPQTITTALRVFISLSHVDEFTIKPVVCGSMIISGMFGTVSDVIVKHNQEETVIEMVLELLVQLVNIGAQIDNEMLALNLVTIPWAKLPIRQINLALKIYTDIASNPAMVKSIGFSGIIPVICQLPSSVTQKDHDFVSSWLTLIQTMANDEQLRFEIRINNIEPQINNIEPCCPSHLSEELKQCKTTVFMPLRKEFVDALTMDYGELGDSNDQIIDLVMEEQLQESSGAPLQKTYQFSEIPQNITEVGRIRSISKSRASIVAEASTLNNKRKCVISEIWTTEKQYIKSLETCLKCFYEPLKRGDFGCTSDQLFHLFITLPSLAEEGKSFLHSLSERMEIYDNTTLIGDVFIRFFAKTPLARLYSEYIVWNEKATAVFHHFQKVCPAFTAWMRQMGASAVTNHMILPSYLIMPVQRLPRYLLLLHSLIEVTPPTHRGVFFSLLFKQPSFSQKKTRKTLKKH
ncbi:RhoGEF domain [Pelomyxa schiedti]|nr:RhoGEF domain [Pelomyxa schiedti]